ncbi:MAG TPA: hypothetical protein VHH11_11085 [Gammaproteobacteria bacterium]|jgi:hypothetical protein|nr:hypothetical protein [Gammaproteobacteria bacterium]
MSVDCRRVAAALLAVTAAALAPLVAGAAEDSAITGIWLPDASRSQRFPANPPFTADGRRIVAEWRASHDPIEDDPGKFCQAPGMPSLALGGADYPVEFVVTPRQVTILMELHQQVRRVFLDQPAHPPKPFPQRNGHSIGHWDGDTLVVDTTAIKAITFGSVPHSDRVHVVERIRAIDAGAALVNEVTITDPAMYTEPVIVRQYYKRAPPGTRMLEYECTEGMWIEHEESRSARPGGAVPPAR